LVSSGIVLSSNDQTILGGKDEAQFACSSEAGKDYCDTQLGEKSTATSMLGGATSLSPPKTGAPKSQDKLCSPTLCAWAVIG